MHGILIACALLTAATAELDIVPPESDAITVMAWHGPPMIDTEVARYWRLKIDGLPAPLNDRAGEFLDLAARGRMNVYFVIPKTPDNGPDAWAAATNGRANAAGWILKYGASPEEAEGQIQNIAALRTIDPAKNALLTLSTSAGIEAWRATLPKLIAGGLPVVCFDTFPLRDDGETDESAFIQYLTLARTALDASAEFWATVQVSAFDGHRAASESDIRYQAYTALALGARGIAYYAYWRDPRWATYTSWGPSMINVQTGDIEYGYEMTAILNRELAQLTPYLSHLRVQSYGFIGDIPEGAPQYNGTETVFPRVIAQRALVSHLRDTEGNPWVMIVNRRFGAMRSAQTQAATIQVVAKPGLATIEEIDRHTGYIKPIPLDQANSFYVTIPGGTASLFRITE